MVARGLTLQQNVEDSWNAELFAKFPSDHHSYTANFKDDHDHQSHHYHNYHHAHRHHNYHWHFNRKHGWTDIIQAAQA